MKGAVENLADRIEGRTEGGLRGSNQSGMRAHNERLVLSLVRHEPMAKSDIARITGLSAQTVSVIMRSLEADGLLLRGEPIRGRIGQPSVPMHLNPEGAFFFGVKIGRRSVDLIRTDFLGRIVDHRHRTYPYPTHHAAVTFIGETLPQMIAAMPAIQRERVAGLGIAMPFQMWNWAQYVGAPASEMAAWRDRDIQAEIAAICPFPVYVQNDATAACSAELVFGTGERPQNFIYFYIGYFVGGGVVINGQLYTGPTGNAGALGSMPVPGPDGAMRQLIQVASMASLERYLAQAGHASDTLWNTPPAWSVPDDIRDRWLDEVARGIAHASLSSTAVLETEAVLIDGWMPDDVRARLVERTVQALDQLDFAGIDRPRVLPGTVGDHARALGAASIPLSQRYLVDPVAILKES